MTVGLHWANLLTIISYLVVVLVIGAWFSRHEENSEEYLLGGRRVPWWAVGISYMMSLLSTGSLVMVPGEIYNHGLSLFLLMPLYPLTSILMFHLFVRFYYRLGVFTPFSYLARRYSSGVRLLITILYLWTRLLYLGFVLFSSSKVFEGAAGWPAPLTIMLVGVIGIVYTMLGGMKAVIWTDVMQFVALLVALLVSILVCAHYLAGGLWGGIMYSIQAGHGADMYAKPEFYALNPYVRALLLDSAAEQVHRAAVLQHCGPDLAAASAEHPVVPGGSESDDPERVRWHPVHVDAVGYWAYDLRLLLSAP